MLRSQGPGLQLAVAAVLVLVVGGPTWLLQLNSGLRSELGTARTEMSRQSAALVAEQEARRLADASRESLEARLAAISTSNFDLFPGTDRGGPMETLGIPPGVSSVRLRLATEETLGPGSYELEIRDGSRAVVWRGPVIDTSSGGGVPEVTVPAPVLAPGQYTLSLSSRRAGTKREIASYSFRIRPR